MEGAFLFTVLGIVVLAIALLFFFISRYRRCPSDKILVIYGKTGEGSAKCLAGGAAFVWPVIQDYQYLDLSPISIDVDLRSALSKQNIRVNVPSRFTVAVSNEPGVMGNAAERLLGKTIMEIKDIAKDIIFGQLRLVVAMMDIEEINADRDKFLANVSTNVGNELRKIGLTLINVNITDIEDESGYIEALGKEAAAHAINEAKKSVAEKNRDGSIGEALALKDQRIKTAEANSFAVEGENKASITIALSNASRQEKEAEAAKIAFSAEKVQHAKALEDAYMAEKLAEIARAEKEKATKEADIIVQTEIAKRKVEIDAEAVAEKYRREAKGEADAIVLRKEAEAKGLFEILKKQAEGFDLVIKAAENNPRDAVLLLIADKLPELVKTQVEAIKNIKFDKVVVWENGGSEKGGNTANFLANMYKAVPPMTELFNMAGLELPSYLGEKTKNEEKPEDKKIVKGKDKSVSE
ncbi:MAG: flotillin family protein [Deltaproteobacteria bacterium]